MARIFALLIILFCNYILIGLIVYTFSYFSLINGKVVDLPWVKYIQKKLYFNGGFRNIFQHSTNNCVKFDKDLLYVPISGQCQFSNIEFETKLNFDDSRRLNSIDDKISEEDNIIAVIGDSIAMGWGVNDDKTFSYNLQKKLKKKVINLGVSSYGTIREIKSLKSNKYYNFIDTILIQYHLNDFNENLNLSSDKKYNQKDFDEYFNSHWSQLNRISFLWKSYKQTLKHPFKKISNYIFFQNDHQDKDISQHLFLLEKIISKNFYDEDKRIIVFLVIDPSEKIIYSDDVQFKSFEFFEVQLNENHRFIIDEHPNIEGHRYIAEQIFRYLKK